MVVLCVDLHGVSMLQSVGSCHMCLKLVGVAWVVASVVKLFGGLWAFLGLVMKVIGTVLAVLRLRFLGPWVGGGVGGSCSVVKLFGG